MHIWILQTRWLSLTIMLLSTPECARHWDFEGLCMCWYGFKNPSSIWLLLQLEWASLVAQRLKHLPAMWETWVRSLGWDDPLEKEMATHSSILAWWIPWMEEPGGLQSTGSQRVGHDWVTSLMSLTYLCTQISFVNIWKHYCLSYIKAMISSAKLCKHVL